MILLGADTADPLRAAIDFYQTVESYGVRLTSLSTGKSEIIRYYFKKPGYVRMEFETSYQGAVLVYNPLTRRVTLWPLGHRTFPALNLSPENKLIQSPTGQRVDRSDVGALFQNVQELRTRGKTELMGMEVVGGRETLHVRVSVGEDVSIGAVCCYQLWLDRTTGFPLKVLSFDRSGRLVETVDLDGLQIHPGFPKDFFSQ